MRTLFIGMFREGSGYSRAAIEYVLALDAAGVDVVARQAAFYPKKLSLPHRLEELLAKPGGGKFDVLFQHCPPYQYDYCGEAGLNVGAFYAETHPLPYSWTSRANQMDLLLASDRHMNASLIAGGITRPVETVPVPADLSRYLRSYTAPKGCDFFHEGLFLFYTVGELVKRKNLSGLLRAYFAEFRPDEPVGLVVKTGMAGQDASEVLKHVVVIHDEVKKGSRFARVPQVFIVPDRMTDDEVFGLHQHCDCFVQPSFAESWSLPAFDAMAMGKTPIVTDAGGYCEYIDNSIGWAVPTRVEPVFAEGDTHGDLFTGRHTWHVPDLLALRSAMRSAYEDADLRVAKSERGLERASQFSHDAVGALLKGVLSRHAETKERSPQPQLVGNS